VLSSSVVKMSRKGTKRKVDPVVEKCDGLTMAIRDLAGLPKDVTTMLLEMIPHCLGQPKDKRHRFQENSIRALDNVLLSIEGNFTKTIGEARAKVEEIRERAASFKTAVAEEEQKLQDDSNRLSEETKMLAKATLELRAARKALQDAKESEKIGGEEMDVATQTKHKVQGIINDLIEPLKSGSVPAPDVDKRCKTLLATLKDLDLDESMLIVLAASLGKSPDARGEFDHLAIGQLDKFIASYIAAQDMILLSDEAGRKERAATVQAAQEALDAALEAQRIRATAFEMSWKAKEDDVRNLEVARKSLKEVASQSTSCGQVLYKVEAESDVFQEYGRKAFGELKEWSTPAPEDPEKLPDATGVVDAVAKIELSVTPVAITA